MEWGLWVCEICSMSLCLCTTICTQNKIILTVNVMIKLHLDQLFLDSLK